MTNIRKRNEELNRRWGLRVTTAGAFQEFRARANHFLRAMVDWDALRETAEERFVLLMGLRSRFIASSNILDALSHTDSLAEFLAVSQQAIWALDESGVGQVTVFVDAIQRSREMSPGIDFRIITKRGVPLFAPAGAKLLDDALVADPLHWLTDHEKVGDRYAQALSIALQKDESQYRNAFDNLRWSVEQLLRIVLHNRKPLEKQESNLLPWLSERGVHQQVVNMYRDLLRRFTAYQNDAVKHGDEWVAPELEFMIYLTGAFMRLLLQLNAQLPPPPQELAGSRQRITKKPRQISR